MSWSIQIIGTTKNVVAALKKRSEDMTDPNSKKEYDAVLPAMITAVEQNFEQTSDPTVKVVASGHGYFADGEQKQGYFTLQVERLYADIV